MKLGKYAVNGCCREVHRGLKPNLGGLSHKLFVFNNLREIGKDTQTWHKACFSTQSERRSTGPAEGSKVFNVLGVTVYKLILLAIAAMTFLSTVPPGGKAGW